MSEVTLPPHSTEAEQSVLAGMILDKGNGLIGEVLAVIPKAEIFYSDRHQKIFSAVIGLYDSSQPVDLVILANRLMELGQINDIGGYAYLQELVSNTISPSTAVAHASIVKNLFTKRSTIHLLREGLRDAESPVGPVAELLERVESGIFSIAAESSSAQVFGADEMIAEMFDFLDEQEIRRREGRPPPGVPTGFDDLDKKICGLHDGELAIIGARPGLGKTALAIAIAGHVAVDLGWPVLFFSLEQRRLELMGRLLCSRGMVDGQSYRKGHFRTSDWDALQRIGNQVRQAPLFVDDDPAQGIVRIAATTRRYKAQKNIRLAIVDYMQIIDPDSITQEAKARNQRWANRQEVVAMFSRRLKQLARHEQIPVLALAQLNRQAQNRASRRPMLSDLRESGAIEADADLVMMLHTEEEDDDDKKEKPSVQEVELLIRKQRNGPTGIVKLNFHRAFTRFESFGPPVPSRAEFDFSGNGVH